jgi:DNA helicase-2/ATP-dependent DNA helicase PcrA
MFSNLNPSQKKAAMHIDGPLLILAGAGSGKTTTITTRLAYLMSIGVDPSSILSLTFTNKAAKQMREKAYELINANNVVVATPPLLCTFHKFGLLFLRFHINKLERENNFIIIDNDDRKRILRSLCKDTLITPSVLGDAISKLKNSCTDAKLFLKAYNKSDNKELFKLYEKYLAYLYTKNLVDFDDLLLLPYTILKNDKQLTKQICDKYKYIMVDEYQDTNELQYKLLSLLVKNHNNICVVGDDDQSIYGWRGANIGNILNFSKHFKNATLIKLEHNYRSCGNILKISNELIEHNSNRLGKKLIPTREDGKKVELFTSNDEKQEGAKITTKIKNLIDGGVKANEIAVLFRVHALSRGLEDSLKRADINYKLIGGVRFYERAEIKDLLAYLRLITKSYDDLFFKRIINTPKRGIGAISIDKIEKSASLQNKNIFTFLNDSTVEELNKLVGTRNGRNMKVFISSILDLQDELIKNPNNFFKIFEENFEFKNYYSKLMDGYVRVANIEELYGYLKENLSDTKNSFDVKTFLDDLSLDGSKESLDDAINLMSIHASKGLEYECIFIIGLEDGFFPIMSNGFDVDIDEERRLAYVAFTRAKNELYLSSCGARFHRGLRTNLKKSQFLIEAGIIKGSLQVQTASGATQKGGFKKDDMVKHKIFGIGRVLGVSKAGAHIKLQINFAKGKKDILASFVDKI